MYQKIIIVGNLGRDPEMRFTPEGNPVTSFSVAASRRYKDKDETTWFRVTVWGKQAETANQYLQKGSKVLVEGRLRRKTALGLEIMMSRLKVFVSSAPRVKPAALAAMWTKPTTIFPSKPCLKPNLSISSCPKT